MRFFTTTLAAIGAVSALSTSTHNPLILSKRQPVVAGTGCATVDVDLPLTVDGLCTTPLLLNQCTTAVRTVLATLFGTTVGPVTIPGPLASITNPVVDICLCTEAGAITPQSAADVAAQLQLNVGTLNAINNILANPVLPLGLNLAAIVESIAELEVVAATGDCEYPDNSTPVCSATACDFVCNTNFEPCNGQCIAEDEDCPTANFARRRRRTSNNLLCEAGRSACALPGNKFGFECLDTKIDVESCGGCAFPLPGAQKGRDCTAIPNIANVACVSGACQIESCLRGFVLHEGECVEKSSLAGIVDDAAEAVGGLAGLVGKFASSNTFRTQNARKAKRGVLKIKSRARK